MHDLFGRNMEPSLDGWKRMCYSKIRKINTAETSAERMHYDTILGT